MMLSTNRLACSFVFVLLALVSVSESSDTNRVRLCRRNSSGKGARKSVDAAKPAPAKASLRRCSKASKQSLSGAASESKDKGSSRAGRKSYQSITSGADRAREWETILDEEIFGKADSDEEFLVLPPLSGSFSYLYEEEEAIASKWKGKGSSRNSGKKSKGKTKAKSMARAASRNSDPFQSSGGISSSQKKSREGALL